eukprot:681001-Rhodomonas_salina.2
MASSDNWVGGVGQGPCVPDGGQQGPADAVPRVPCRPAVQLRMDRLRLEDERCQACIASHRSLKAERRYTVLPPSAAGLPDAWDQMGLGDIMTGFRFCRHP